MDNIAKFFIVSSVRSGSTWLETMLGSLSDVTVDFEFKWLPQSSPYTLSPVHKHVPNSNFSCGKALEALPGDTPVKGSKLTLDACIHSHEEYSDLKKTIDKEIRIIHLRRRYRDVYLSLIRGCIHLVNNTSNVSKDGGVSVILASVIDGECNSLKSLDRSPFVADPLYCRSVMESLAAHDQWVSSLDDGSRHFVTVDYKQVSKQFSNLASFVGSKSSSDEIDSILSQPPTKKLPQWPFEKRIINYGELEEIFSDYEGTVVGACRTDKSSGDNV